METRGSWTSLCRLSTAKESVALAKVRIGTIKVAKVARMEERTLGRRAAARKEAKGKRKVTRENPRRVGRVARQDTLQLGAGKEETRTCTPQTKTTARTLNNRPRMRRTCWQKAKINSGASMNEIFMARRAGNEPFEVSDVSRRRRGCCKDFNFDFGPVMKWSHFVSTTHRETGSREAKSLLGR